MRRCWWPWRSPKRLKRHTSVAIKVLLSAGLLAYLLRSVDLENLIAHLVEGNHSLFAVAVTIYAVVVGLSTLRWKMLLDPLGGQTTFRALARSYMVSAFFANFLPGNLGGDVVRVEAAARAAGSRTASLTVAAVDRIVGFVALYFIAAPAYLLGGPVARGLSGASLILLGLTLLLLVLLSLFLWPELATPIIAWSGVGRVPWAAEQLALVGRAVDAYRSRKAVILLALLLSLVLQFLGVSYFFVVARALRIPLAPGMSLLMIPLCTLLQAIPISFNGWGLREGIYVIYFQQVGLSRENALAFSIVAASLVALLSTSGLLVWVTDRPEQSSLNSLAE